VFKAHHQLGSEVLCVRSTPSISKKENLILTLKRHSKYFADPSNQVDQCAIFKHRVSDPKIFINVLKRNLQ
jgi:hypothetical protein